MTGMILGIGNDLVDIRRIEKLWKEQGQRFLDRIFTEDEQAYAMTRQPAGETAVAAVLAKRFAAKEAAAKALETGIGEIHFTDIEVTRQPSGQPELVFHRAAEQRWQAMLNGGKGRAHLSLTDEYPYAQAFVVLSWA